MLALDYSIALLKLNVMIHILYSPYVLDMKAIVLHCQIPMHYSCISDHSSFQVLHPTVICLHDECLTTFHPYRYLLSFSIPHTMVKHSRSSMEYFFSLSLNFLLINVKGCFIPFFPALEHMLKLYLMHRSSKLIRDPYLVVSI